MPNPEDYTTIRIHEDDRDKAREVKNSRNQTWREFISDAAEALDTQE